MKFSILCACASLVVAAPAAMADEVVIADLLYDASILDTAEGAKETYVSLKKQAKKACQTKTEYGVTTDRSCAKEMILSAIEQIDSPVLTAVHEGTSLPFRLASK